MSTFILAEKPDQARAYMRGLGIKYKSEKANYGKGPTFLDEDTVVIGSRGHMFELSEPESYGEKYKDRYDLSALPIFPKNFKYDGKESLAVTFDMMSNAGKYADKIIIATDKDNEGAAIGYNILKAAGLLNKNIYRAYPTGLNAAAVKRTFENLESIDQTWRDSEAAIARSKSDWLIGMNLSRLYTTNLKNIDIYGNFAIGRAISSTLNLICEWYKEIENFREEPTFTLNAKAKLREDIIVDLRSDVKTEGNGENDPKQDIQKRIQSANLTIDQETIGEITNLSSNQKESYVPELLTKSSLYTEMARVAGWSQKRSESVMQLNYEQGWQTYPRTDSSLISQYMYEYLYSNFDKYMHSLGLDGQYEKYDMPVNKLKNYVTSEKSAGAHMAIIPTEQIMPTKEEEAKIIEAEKAQNKDKKKMYQPLTEDQRLMLDVIYRNTLALILPPHRYVSNKIEITTGTDNPIIFTASNTATLNQGWKEIIPKSKKKNTSDNEKIGQDYSNIVTKGQKIPLNLELLEGKTRPPKPLKSIQLYAKKGLMEKAYKYAKNENEAKILRKVKGIGTSATKDQIIESLVNKKYITVDSKDVINVTANGWLINMLLQGSQVSSVGLTARWEEAYLQISKGKMTADTLITATEKLITSEMNRVGTNWNKDVIIKYFNQRKQIENANEAAGVCPVCKKGYIIFSKYYGKKKEYQHGEIDRWRCDQCNFFIYKKYSNISFTKSDIKQLISGKTTRVIKDIKAFNKDKKYDAKFKLKTKDDGKLKPSPIFVNKSTSTKKETHKFGM